MTTLQSRPRSKQGTAAPLEPGRRRFTAAEYHRMGRAGILGPEERTELLEGEIVVMAPIGGRHMACVNGLARRFILRLGDRVIVSIQNPVRLAPGSEPQPDLALLRPRPDDYGTGLPGPADILLVIEVADSTLRYDRDRKLPLYAAAGIPEAWIVDLRRRRVLVYRAPANGRYADQTEAGRDAVLSPLAFPDLALPVAEIIR